MMNQAESKRMEILSQFCLDDKTVIVTGGGRGIGEGIALQYAGLGANVVIAQRSSSEAVAEKIRALGRKALPLTINVTDSDDVQRMTEKTLAEFGRIDILVNNAGGVSGHREPMLDMSDDVWDSVIALNLTGTFLCSKFVGRVMKDQKKGNIINISSCSGLYPYPSMPPYGAAKAGVINLTRSLAVYLAPYNIRVNCIAPGAISTSQGNNAESDESRAERYAIPLARIGYPQDIAFAATYLASDASDYVTGIVMEVGGGPMLGKFFLRQAEENWNIDGKK